MIGVELAVAGLKDSGGAQQAAPRSQRSLGHTPGPDATLSRKVGWVINTNRSQMVFKYALKDVLHAH